MAKQPDRKIDAPKPVRGQRLDVGPLEAILREELGKHDSDTRTVMEAASRWLTEHDPGIPVKQAITVAYKVFWRLADEAD